MPTNDPNFNIRELLVRIDERTLTLLKSHEDLKDTVDNSIDDLKQDVEKNYTKKSDFEPVRRLVFGFVGFILLSVGGMFIGLLIRSNSTAAYQPSLAIMKNANPAMMSAMPSIIRKDLP